MNNEPNQNLPEGLRPFLSAAHPAHVEYMRKMPVNTLDYFLTVVGELDLEEHADIFRYLFLYSLPECGYDRQAGGINLPEVTRESITAFAARCRRAAQVVSEPAVVTGAVVRALSELFTRGDTSSVEEMKSRLMRMAEKGMRGELGDSGPPPDEAVGWLVDHMEHLPEKTEKAHGLYVHFCENVLRRLLDQPPFG